MAQCENFGTGKVRALAREPAPVWGGESFWYMQAIALPGAGGCKPARAGAACTCKPYAQKGEPLLANG